MRAALPNDRGTDAGRVTARNSQYLPPLICSVFDVPWHRLREIEKDAPPRGFVTN